MGGGCTTCFNRINWHPSSAHWIAERRVFICTDPESRWKGETSTVRRISRRQVLKTYHEGFRWMGEREAQALERLEGEPGFPEQTGWDGRSLGMTWVGRRLPSRVKWSESIRHQGMLICQSLERGRIRHRDIRPSNLCEVAGRLSLVDFGWCLFDDERETPEPAPACLGTEPDGRRWGRNDAAAMHAVLNR